MQMRRKCWLSFIWIPRDHARKLDPGFSSKRGQGQLHFSLRRPEENVTAERGKDCVLESF